MSSWLLKGGCVLTLGKGANYVEADVLIQDDRVAEVGAGLRARDAEVVDASDTIVMPGFVDTHRHTWRTLLRHVGDGDRDARAWADGYGPHHQPDDVYAATLLGLLSAVEAGITTVVDWSDIQLDDRYTEAALQAHTDAGLRTVFVHAAPGWAAGGADRGAALRRLVADRAAGAGSLITIALGPADPSLGDLTPVTTDWGLARDLGLRIHVHVGVDPSASGVVAGLGGRRLLGADVTLVHGTNLDDEDLDAVASHGAAVAFTPASEMARGLGTPPVQKLIDRSIRPGLGIDDQRLSPGDVFAQMRSVQSIQHANSFDLRLAGKTAPALLGTREVIRYATVDGARVAGLADAIGSLEPGKQADVLVLRTDRPNIFPVNDPIGAVVWGMDASNVDWVFVGGRPLVRAGVLDADVDRVRNLAITARERVATAAGPLVESGNGGAR